MSEGARIFKNIDEFLQLRITFFSQNIPYKWQPASLLEAIAARTLYPLQSPSHNREAFRTFGILTVWHYSFSITRNILCQVLNIRLTRGFLRALQFTLIDV
jgi:hypothetical protein